MLINGYKFLLNHAHHYVAKYAISCPIAFFVYFLYTWIHSATPLVFPLTLVGVLFSHKAERLKENPSISDMRQYAGLSKRTQDQMAKFIKIAAPLSQSGDWQFCEQLLKAWNTYLYNVMLTVIEGKKAEAKLSNQVWNLSCVPIKAYYYVDQTFYFQI